MPRKPMNLDGQRFGMLTVQRITDQRNNYGRILYLCRCDCGGERLATAGNLRSGEVVCCGCLYHRPKLDLTGRRFGRLVVLECTVIPQKSRTSYNWRCRCDCGAVVEVNGNDLTSGNTTSCGCAQKDAVKAMYRDGTAPNKLTESQHPRRTNTSGYTGVSWDKRRHLWCAEIIFRRKKYFLGRFANIEDAISARKAAEEKYFKPIIDNQKETQND